MAIRARRYAISLILAYALACQAVVAGLVAAQTAAGTQAPFALCFGHADEIPAAPARDHDHAPPCCAASCPMAALGLGVPPVPPFTLAYRAPEAVGRVGPEAAAAPVLWTIRPYPTRGPSAGAPRSFPALS